MSAHNFMPLLIATFAAQASVSTFTTAQVLVDRFAPAAIEGVASLPDRVKAGETVIADWTITKRIDCPGINSRVWNGADGFHITEASKPTSLPTSPDAVEYDIPTQIPEGAPPGTLSLAIFGQYHCTGAEPVHFVLGPATTVVE